MVENLLKHDPSGNSDNETTFCARSDARKFVVRSSLLFVSVFIYVAYALLDSVVMGMHDGVSMAIRLLFVAPALLAIAVAFAMGTFNGREHLAFMACVAVTGGSVLAIYVIDDGNIVHLLMNGFVTIAFSGWMLFLPSVRQTSLMGAVALLAFCLMAVVSGMDKAEVYIDLFFVSMGCSTLAAGMFFLENSQRSHEVYQHELQQTINTLRESEKRAVALYREAKQAEKTKNEFLAVVSHELRTPMNAIIGFSEIISTEMLGKIEPPQYREYSVYIQDSGRQLLNLINDILDVSRAEIDKITFEMKEFDIGATVNSAITACYANAEQAGVMVKRVTPGLHDVMVRGDESRLLQAMTNIVGNAIKFSEEGGTVLVDLAYAHDGSLRFMVTDTGIGIGPEDIDNIKQPFKQAESAFVRNKGGLGLGLAICNIVANAHSGTLNIDSTLGKGTTVSITLPETSLAVSSKSRSAA